jgi:hypothetical protein
MPEVDARLTIASISFYGVFEVTGQLQGFGQAFWVTVNGKDKGTLLRQLNGHGAAQPHHEGVQTLN